MIKIDHILKQSWRILWNYRVLWIFGLLLTLTGGGGAGRNSNFNFNSSRRDTTPGQWQPGQRPSLPADAPAWAREFVQWFEQNLTPLFMHPEDHIATFVWIGVAIFLFILFVSLLAALVRYPSETAVIRMVDEHEQSGTKVGFRAGWRLGWNQRAFRLWVIDLVLGLPVLAFMLGMLAAGLLIFFSVRSGSNPATVFGSLAAVVFFLMVLLVFILLMVGLSLLRNFFARAAALEGLGVLDSLRSGWRLFRQQWKSAGLMWLVMLGVGIAFGIASIVAFFILIPAYLLLLLPAALVAALPGLLAAEIASLFTAWPLAAMIGIIIALPFFFSVLFAPLLLLSGWFIIFDSCVWTLTYREMKALSAPVALDEAIPPAAPLLTEEQNPPEIIDI